MSDLALFGGSPAVSGPLKPFRTIGLRERTLVNEVLDDGLLSGFYGSWGPEFRGGRMVRRLEEQWAAKFDARHAVSVNSATSGLIAAMGAVGIGPGDEVIVPPYTMSATAVAPLFYGGIPVFADVEPETYCLDPARVAEQITARTKAIIVVNLFGHPAALAELRALADRHGVALVEDNAQGILARENGRFAGTIGHIGVFSLNVHKHIQAGEGGICTTEDDTLALRLQAIRNHGENVVQDAGIANLANIVGFNIRMTELSAAVTLAQLERVDEIVAGRQAVAQRLSAGLEGMPGIAPPTVREGCEHVYYVLALRLDEAKLGFSRDRFIKAVKAEGVPLYAGYVNPLYRLPLFQQRIAIGRNGFPFNLVPERRYDDGLCPVAERLHDEEFVGYEICAYDPTPGQLEQMIAGIRKVVDRRRELSDRTA